MTIIHPIEDLAWFYGGGAEADTGYVSATGPQIEALRSGGGTRLAAADGWAAALVDGWVSPPTPSPSQVQAVAKLRRIYHAVCQLEGVHQAVLQLAYAPRSYTTPDRRGQAGESLTLEERIASGGGYRDRRPSGDRAFGRLYEDGRKIEAEFGLAAGPVLVAMVKTGKAVELARRELEQAAAGAKAWKEAEASGEASDHLEYHAPERLKTAKAALAAAERAARDAPGRAVRLVRDAHAAYEAIVQQKRLRRHEERQRRAQEWWEKMKRNAEARHVPGGDDG